MPEPSPISGPAPAPDQGVPTGLRDLAAVLIPGAQVSGRVLEALGNQQYLVLLRGRTLVAQSATALKQGEVVRVQVEGVGDQVTAKLISGVTAEPITAGRMQALGLPQGPASMLVLEAFERAGAPLQTERMRAAVVQVEEAFDLVPTNPGPKAQGSVALPPPERLATAFALLARANLPASGPLVALALRAADTTLPNPARALVDLQRIATAAGITVPAADPDPTPDQRQVPVPWSSNEAPRPVVITAANTATTTAPGPAATALTQTAPTANALPVAMPPALPGAAPPPSSITAASAGSPPTTLPGSSVQPPVAGTTVPGPSPVPGPPGVVALNNSTVPVADGERAPVAATTIPSAAESATRVVPPTTSPVPTDQTAMQRGQTIPEPSATVSWRAILADPIPDGSRDGAAGIMRALALAGLRVGVGKEALPSVETQFLATTLADEASSPAGHPAPRLTQHLAATLTSPVAQPVQDHAAPAPASAPPTTAMPAVVTDAVVRVGHEQAAQTVFPPEHLMDYNRVMGLPLMADGQPTPARLAVSRRVAPGGGNATYLRVDAELTRLGPVSVRLSGIDGGAMAITLVAAPGAATVLAEGLPELAADLRQLGITAGLRVVGDDGIERGGAASHG